MDSSCPVQVALRVRDLVPRERLEGFFSCINVSGSTTAVLGGERSFAFDYAFGPDTSQATVYDSSVRPLIESALSGINVSVLAYGQTGSGKTHTMGTDGLLGKSPEEYGVVPRIACDVFQACKEMIGLSIVVSALEIYGEELRDLISDDGKSKLQIREDRNGQITVVGLQEVAVSSRDELLGVLGKGLLKRATGSTNMNAESSRSHALCTITLQSTSPSLTTGLSPCKYPSMSQSAAAVYSKIQLVDLAGSERLTQTLSKTTKETCQINRGLHALSNVIIALSTPAPSAAATPHVPYRDSKLTRVLQDSLGGSAKTLMIACVSAADESVQESLSTLQYATRARRIQNRICAPVSEQVPTPSDDSIVNLQWTLLRKYLSCVGLMPLPEILMQDLQGKDDEGTRMALLQAANKCFSTSPGKAAHTFPRSATDFSHLSAGSAPGALPSHSSHTNVSNSACVHALSEPGCSPALQATPSEHALTSTMPKSEVASSRASICSADAASQTVTTEALAPCTTPERRVCSAETSTANTPRDLRDSAAAPAHDIALKYVMQSQESSADGSVGSRGGGPRALRENASRENCSAPAESVLSNPGAAYFGSWCERSSSADCIKNARDIVVFDEEQASYISSTDYTCALDISGHQARLLAEHEDAALAAADTQNRLLGTIRELEAEVMCQEGKLQAARDVEARACRERDNAQNACAQLQHQIELQQRELEDLHKGMRELEASLDRSEADKAAARMRYEERIQAANARKNSLEVQLRSQAAAASENVAAASKIRELSQNLEKLQASKANAVRDLRASQTEHRQRESKMQSRLVALQRQLRGSERRAAVLQQDKERTATVLQRKRQQLQDCKQTVQELQASLEASERRAAAAAVAGTTPDKSARRQCSQDGSCASGSRSTTSEAAHHEAAQRTGWWDEQISLLAQRVSAGKRTEHLQQRLSDIAQQITAAQQSPSPESGTALEDLKLQQNVLKSSLAVGRERITSSTLIQRNLQHAAATLPAPAVRKVLLHLVSSTLSAYTAACSSRAETHHLHTSLDRMCKLNNLLTVQVKSSIGISSHSPSSESNHVQSGDAPIMLTRAQSPRQQHLGFPLSPKQTTQVNLRDDSSDQFSPVALDSNRPLSQHTASPMAAAMQPNYPQRRALSADNLVHVDQASPATAKATPGSIASRSCVSSTQHDETHDRGNVQGSRERDWSVFSSAAKQHSFQSVSGSCSLNVSQATQDTSQLFDRMHLDPSGSGSNIECSPGKHTAITSSGNDKLDAERVMRSPTPPMGGVGGVNQVSQGSSTKVTEFGITKRSSPVDGLQTSHVHSTGFQTVAWQSPKGLKSHAISKSSLFHSSEFPDLSQSGSVASSSMRNSSMNGKLTATEPRGIRTPAKTEQRTRPRSATPKRVSFADDHGSSPRRTISAADDLFGDPTTGGSPQIQSIRSHNPHSFQDQVHTMPMANALNDSADADADPAKSPMRSPQRAEIGSAAAANVAVGVTTRVGDRGRYSGAIASPDNLSSFKVRDNPVAAHSDARPETPMSPIRDPQGSQESMNSRFERTDLNKTVSNLLVEQASTGVDQRWGVFGAGPVSGSESSKTSIQRQFMQGGNGSIEGHSKATMPQQHASPAPRFARTPPAKVQAYRKKLEELQAKSSDLSR